MSQPVLWRTYDGNGRSFTRGVNALCRYIIRGVAGHLGLVWVVGRKGVLTDASIQLDLSFMLSVFRRKSIHTLPSSFH